MFTPNGLKEKAWELSETINVDKVLCILEWGRPSVRAFSFCSSSQSVLISNSGPYFLTKSKQFLSAATPTSFKSTDRGSQAWESSNFISLSLWILLSWLFHYESGTSVWLLFFPSSSPSIFCAIAALKGLIRAIKKYQFCLFPLFNNK